MTLEEPPEFNHNSWVVLGVRPNVIGVVVSGVVVAVVDDASDVPPTAAN